MMKTEHFLSHLHDPKKPTIIMGILNVTPDSFSDGGQFDDPKKAIDHALQMVEEGAEIIDIGGESTRPGAEPVELEKELGRILPVIEGIRKHSEILISVDTYKASIARQAIITGAQIINDISGLNFDPEMPVVVKELKAPVVLMHIKGTPKNMQVNPHYDDLMEELIAYFNKRIDAAKTAGIDDHQIIIDPGIGFGKCLDDNFEIIRELKRIVDLGYPVLIGPSRKSFIGLTLELPTDQRVEGTAAAVTACILNGTRIVRVHDVKEMKRVSIIADKIRGIV